MKATHHTHSNYYSNPRIDREGSLGNAISGTVYLDISKTIWVTSMLLIGTVGSLMTASVGAIVLFISFTALTLLFGHSLGMHRRFIHRSYGCSKWMEYLFVHLGTIVGLAGPFGMLKTHDMRDWHVEGAAVQGQWGPGWWTLIALEKLGLVKDLVTPEKIQTRDELVRL